MQQAKKAKLPPIDHRRTVKQKQRPKKPCLSLKVVATPEPFEGFSESVREFLIESDYCEGTR